MLSHVHVCAVVVSHNGARFLPETLSALTAQSRPADFCIGVDAGSTDASASLLQLGLPVGSPVIAAPARGGFGAAVKAGLAELPKRGGADRDPASEWIWLLHDDSAPAPGALEELLLAVERAPSVTIAGAKQVHWDNERRLMDVGISVNRWAERLTLIDADELDQGQYDSRSDIFAVNSAGMLIRRDAWDQLGGFDPALPGSGDDIDLCWRNRLAGNRVVVVPAAGVRHAGDRPNPAASEAAARRAEIFLRLKHAPLWQVPFLAVGAVLGGIGRFFLGMLAKDPGYAAASLVTSVAAVCRPLDLYRSRRRAASTRTRPRNAVNALRSTGREVREHRRTLTEAHTGPNGPGGEEYVPSGDASDDFAALEGSGRSWVGLGALAGALLLAAASLTGLHRLIGVPAASGGALLPLGPGVAGIWDAATGWWAQAGSGYPAHGDPFGFVLSLLAMAGFGNGNTAVLVLLMLALPLAGLSAWFAAGVFTQHRGLRFWAAVFWAAVPAFQTALGSGRLGSMIAHILLPLTVLAIARAVGAGKPAPGAGAGRAASWTAAAAAGLLLAVLTAAAPILFVLAVAAVLILTLALRRRARTLWWSLLPPAALLLPQVLSAAPDHLRAVLADPGVPLAFDRSEPWQQLLGYPVAFTVDGTLSGLLPQGPWNLVLALLIGAPVVVLAALGLFRTRTARLARLAWILAVTSLAVNAAASYLGTAATADSVVTAFAGPLVSATVLLLLGAALACAADVLPGSPAPVHARRPPRSRRSLAVVLGLVLAAGPAASLALWAVPQFTGNGFPGTAANGGPNDAGILPGLETAVQGAPARTLPATAADAGYGDAQSRSLVLHADADGNVTAVLMRGGGTTLEQLSTVSAARGLEGVPGTPGADDPATADLRRAVAVITAGTGVDPRAELARLGVAFVVLQESDTAAELLAGRMDSVPGLAAVGQTGAGWLWRVTEPLNDAGTETQSGLGARVRILNADGSTAAAVPSHTEEVRTTLEAGVQGRTLVLAERADDGWQATLDGRPLAATEGGWEQAFELPADGGELVVAYRSPWEPWVEALQVLVIGLTVLLALPTPGAGRTIRLPGKRHAGADAADSTAAGSSETDAAGPDGPAAAAPAEVPAQDGASPSPVRTGAGSGPENRTREGNQP
ncbi:glycosyltransferase family 2 protein [Arthrobacter sp. zg.Y20]|nr:MULTISPECIES: glycosyltransferase family 2 protein [unclassified Arthrobacter]MDK1317356.1 glycosyltransferase family 2 protein [Arthrobacter sp. zg.Y20]WIB07780.1 glycosyltransferase family 2 protein [Arthrobacter sp. zg-Y20]